MGGSPPLGGLYRTSATSTCNNSSNNCGPYNNSQGDHHHQGARLSHGEQDVAGCKYWSFIATQAKCLLLKSCDKASDEDGVDSGAKGCVPPTLKFVIVDFHDKAATEGKVVWEKDTVCPTSTFTIDASKTTTVEYTSKCGKLKTIDVKSDAKECDQFKTETDQPIPTFYLKAKADGTAAGKCELDSNPKILVK